MSLSMRRTGVVLLGLAVLALVVLLQPASGQQRVQIQMKQPLGLPGGDKNPSEYKADIDLPTEPKLKKKLDAAGDYIREESWGEASRILQGLLDISEDKFVEDEGIGTDGKPTKKWVSVRTKANQLLGTIPPKGLEHYRLSYGTVAKDLLNEAKANGDASQLAQVAQRFLYTEAGAEATNLLGTHLLDRGHFVMAALCFKRLIEREGADKLPPSTLLKAVLAFHRTGDVVNKEETWKMLAAKVGGAVRLGDRTVSLTELQSELDAKYKGPLAESNIYDWGLYRGNASRTAQGNGGAPFLEKRYSRPTVGAQTVDGQYVDSPQAKSLLAAAVKTLEQREQAVLPAFFPVAADGKLVYRSYWGVHAIDIKSGKLAWEAGSKLSLENLIKDGGKYSHLQNWVQQYLGGAAGPNIGRPSILFENSTTGTLSTDNQFVFAVDDLPLPPLPNPGMDGAMVFPGGGRVGSGNNYGQLAEAVACNKLQAYNLKSGKLVWELWGKGENPGDPDFSDTFFLGPPLPLQNKLYVLTEKAQELRLVCLDPTANPKKAEVVWTQGLASTKNKLLSDPIRRTQAAHLAYGEGILVCPTNAGAILGVDLLTHSLIWAHFYREKNEAANPLEGPFPPGAVMMPGGMVPPNFNPNSKRFTQSEWKVTAPAVQDGKVVFTAPDGSGIHCLDLRDGTLLWKANRADDDLYLGGVIAGKVLLVGKKECRALNLADGAEAWRKETGKPSGQGVASGGIYYLPLRSSAANKDEPQVCAIDVAKGAIVANTKTRKLEDVPGNLLFYEGDVLSQGIAEVAAFPQMKVKLDQMNDLIAKNPLDPVGLTDRGELNLYNGKWQAAVDDLRQALANNPPRETAAKARTKLHETLTEYLSRNFDDAEKYLAEYRELCKVPVDPTASPAERQKAEQEEQRRNAAYYFLLAKGREGQGKLLDAFDAYLQYATSGAETPELQPIIGERGAKAPPEVLARGQIGAMVAQATEEQRKPLEERIAQKYAEVKDGADPEALRRFVSLFGLQFKVGREARLQMAERLLDEEGTASLVEAERQLLLLRHQEDSPQLAAQAVEALARLMARKGMMEDAAHYYRVLGEEFASIKVRDGKTGKDLLDELPTDKRFLPYLDEPGQLWNGVDKKVKEEFGTFQQTKTQFQFEPDGEVLPFFQRHRVVLDMTNNAHDFKLIDRLTGEERVKLALTRTTFQQFLWAGGNTTPPRYTFQTVGHVVVLPLGHMVFAIDTINKKLLWEKSLIGASLGQQNPNVTVDPRDNSFVLAYADGFTQRLGQTGPVQASYVCLQTRDGLMALDPLNGTPLWTRPDVKTNSHVFGDQQHVYVVELNQEGNPSGTRALRAEDGATVPVADFKALFTQRQRILGNRLLVWDQGPPPALRLYDVLAGKDVWKKEFPAGSIPLRCEQPELAGAVEPKGRLTVFDLRTRKPVLEGEVDPKKIDKAQSVALLQDRTHFYALVQGPQDTNANPWGGPWSNFMPTTGLRSVPVNGMVYAFDRETGKQRWNAEVAQQMLVLDNFGDLPFLLFTSRYQKLMGAGVNRWAVNGVSVKAIEKRTGKMKYDQPELNNNNAQQFHAFKVDLRSGSVELTSYNFRVTFNLEHAAVTTDAAPTPSAKP